MPATIVRVELLRPNGAVLYAVDTLAPNVHGIEARIREERLRVRSERGFTPGYRVYAIDRARKPWVATDITYLVNA